MSDKEQFGISVRNAGKTNNITINSELLVTVQEGADKPHIHIADLLHGVILKQLKEKSLPVSAGKYYIAATISILEQNT